MPGRNFHAGAALIHIADFIELAEIELGIDAAHVEVEGDSDHVKITSAFTVSKQGALDAVGAGEQAQFRGGHAGRAVIVSVEADDEGVAMFDVAADPFDLVGIDIGGRDLDGIRQVQNHLPFGGRFPYVHHGFGDLFGELDFGGAEAFGRVLKHDFGALEPRESFLDEGGPAHGDTDDLLFRHPKDDATLGRRSGVVEVDDGFPGADQRLKGAFD